MNERIWLTVVFGYGCSGKEESNGIPAYECECVYGDNIWQGTVCFDLGGDGDDDYAASIAHLRAANDLGICDRWFLPEYCTCEDIGRSDACDAHESVQESYRDFLTDMCTDPKKIDEECDGGGDCDECGRCSYGDGEECESVYNVCSGNDDCMLFINCMGMCSDDACDACYDDYAGGVDAAIELLNCVVCNACPVDCSATDC